MLLACGDRSAPQRPSRLCHPHPLCHFTIPSPAPNPSLFQLRDLVPPQGGDAGSVAGLDAPVAAGGGGDPRRPKHVVLSDAIRLIKDLQLQVAEMQLSPHSDNGRCGCWLSWAVLRRWWRGLEASCCTKFPPAAAGQGSICMVQPPPQRGSVTH